MVQVPPAPGGPDNLGATGKSIPDARKQLIQARCSLEQRCNNVGPNKSFASQELCVNQVAKDWADALGSCAHGVNPAALNACVQSMTTNTCDHKLKDLSDISTCKDTQLCLASK